MGLSLNHFGSQATAGTAATVTVTIPANSAVGLIALLTGGYAMGYHQGSVADSSGSNTYTAAGGANVGGTSYYCDAFYCLNTGSSATTITYTPSASYTTLYVDFAAAWVWSVTGGNAIFGSQISATQASPGTATDGVTSGAVTCASGSVVMGICNDTGGNSLSAGTGFVQDVFNVAYATLAEHGAFNLNQAATWTDSVGTAAVFDQAMSFGFSSSAGPTTNPISGISRLGVVAPLAWVIRRRQQRARELRRWKRDDASGLILPDYKRVA